MLLAYAAERLHLRPLLAAAFTLAGAAALVAGWRGATQFAADFCLVLALIVHFRIWDDISDRDRDAIRDPERVTVRASSLTPLKAIGVTIAVACAVAALRNGAAAAVVLVAIWLSFAAWYRWRGPRTAWSDHVLVAKYPAFVAIAAGSRISVSPLLVALTLGVVYLAFSVYEAWHDAEAPQRRSRLAVEAPLLGSLTLALYAFAGGTS